ncbi:MAG: FAD-dependent oxidoreductase [Coriobacteriales bacterium]|jgi:electron transfer flavoprotein-quinone oxidoreductase|nr:FAD-dependent oxidoreductase [Coriobacteriales bacterium]
MDDDVFDAIVVGGGLAGSAAAYTMAKDGLNVLLVERGNYAGAKNMTGGRIYAHCLYQLMPDFADRAPLERKVTHEKVSMLTHDSAATMDFSSEALCGPGSESYVVLRSKFDRWLFDEAESAGAVCATGMKVDDLLVRDGKVCGIICGTDEIEGNVVVLADGLNSALAQRAGLSRPLAPEQAAVGLKGVWELPAATITDRFGTANDDEGTAWLFAGSPSNGLMGGGFLYTNRDSISLGLVIGLAHIDESDKPVTRLLDEFAGHPVVTPLLRGAKLAEYSAHALTEAGLSAVPKLYGDGVLVCGDAAGLCINTGYMVRGMDFAISSGYYAARAICDAKAAGDYGASALASYGRALDASYVMSDMRLYKDFPAFMENPRIFNEYPDMISKALTSMFMVDGKPERPLMRKVKPLIKQIGYMTLFKDARKGVKAL